MYAQNKTKIRRDLWPETDSCDACYYRTLMKRFCGKEMINIMSFGNAVIDNVCILYALWIAFVYSKQLAAVRSPLVKFDSPGILRIY